MKTQKRIDGFVKFASLGVMGWATWAVAWVAFGDAPGLLRVLLAGCAVGLVEGVILSNWHLLDTKRQASDGEKFRYAMTLWIMFGAALVVALRHGEGVEGLVFRLAIGLAIGGSTWDVVVKGLAARRRREDKGERVYPRVRRARRRELVRQQLAGISSEAQIFDADLRVKTSALLAAVEDEGRGDVSPFGMAVNGNISVPGVAVGSSSNKLQNGENGVRMPVENVRNGKL